MCIVNFVVKRQLFRLLSSVSPLPLDLNMYILNRKYAERRVRDYFRETRTLADSAAIEKEYNYGLGSLEMLKRQVYECKIS